MTKMEGGRNTWCHHGDITAEGLVGGSQSLGGPFCAFLDWLMIGPHGTSCYWSLCHRAMQLFLSVLGGTCPLSL